MRNVGDSVSLEPEALKPRLPDVNPNLRMSGAHNDRGMSPWALAGEALRNQPKLHPRASALTACPDASAGSGFGSKRFGFANFRRSLISFGC